jgi:hypothetical protein
MNTTPQPVDDADRQFEEVIKTASEKHRAEIGHRRRWDRERRVMRTAQLRYEIERAEMTAEELRRAVE